MFFIADERARENQSDGIASESMMTLVCDEAFNLLSASANFHLQGEDLHWDNLGLSPNAQLQFRMAISKCLEDGHATFLFDEADAPFNGLRCLKCFETKSTKGPWVTAVFYACNDLELQLADLKESNRELEKYAYNASHDLQEPLNNVTSYLHLMRLQAGEEMDERSREYMNNALAATGNMKTLVKNLLEYSKVGNQKLKWEKTTFSDLLAPVILLLDSQIRAKDATIRLKDNKEFECDRFHYSTLFQNLISNALKFVRDGLKPKIELGIVEQETHFEFSVSDNGVGIPKTKHKDVFKTFKRLQNGTASGHGLGMAIAKRVVEKHGGTITLESEVDQGTTFRFTLPKR